MDLKEIFDADDVELFEKSSNMTWSERRKLAYFVQHIIEVLSSSTSTKSTEEPILLNPNILEEYYIPLRSKLSKSNEIKTKTKKFVKLYKELTDVNTDVGMQALSEKLSALADRLGFTEEAREMMTETTKVESVLMNLTFALCGELFATRIVGSKAEGTGKLNQETDTDILQFDPLIKIFKASLNSESNLPYLRMVVNKITPAGYVKLQLFQNDRAVYETSIGNIVKDYGTYFRFLKLSVDKGGRVFLSSEFKCVNPESFVKNTYVQNGPAITIDQAKTGGGIDSVCAYICDTLPDEVLPWFNRKRQYGWPSEETMKLFKQMGCIVVPVGHANSPEAERKLQWRLSFSNQEMYLMHNLNTIQYKCYVILKHLKNIFIKGFSKSLCTYHIKTALFYTIENSCPSIWQPKYLAYAVSKCLHKLKEWVVDMNCPNYFIPEENMFETKLNQEEKRKLMDLFSILFCRQLYIRLLPHACEDEIWFKNDHLLVGSYRILNSLDLLFMELIISMEMKCTSNQDICKMIEYLTIFTRNDKLALCPISLVYTAFPEILIVIFFMKYAETVVNGTCLQQFLTEMPTLEYIYPILINNSAFSRACGHVQSFLHSKIASNALLSCHKPTEQERDLTFAFVDHQVRLSGIPTIYTIMKQASCLYNDEHYETVNKMLERICNVTELPVACFHFKAGINNTIMRNMKSFRKNTHHNAVQKLESNQLTIDYLTTVILPCFQFDSMEKLMAPKHLQYEALKAFGASLDPRFMLCKKLSFIVIDAIIFIYYLLYKNNEAIDDMPRMNLALCRMVKVIFEHLHEFKLYHFDTALNTLGHIYVTKCWQRLALSCFRKSLENESLYNSAKWHIMFLLFG